MNLSNIRGQSPASQTAGNAATGASGGVSGSSGSQTASPGSLQTGHTIQGTVVGMKGNEVVIAMDNGTLLNARMDKDIQLSEGQVMTFEIKSNNGSRIALSPLFENMGHDPNVLKALAAAGMPATDKNIGMVAALMREGLPVSKQSLLEFGRQMFMNPTASPETLAQLDRLQIPATPENIAQLEAYKNYEHQISQSVLEIADGLTDTFVSMIKGGDAEAAVNLYKQVLSLLTEAGLAKSEPIGADTAAGNKGPLPTDGEHSGAAGNGAGGPETVSQTELSGRGAVSADLSGVLLEALSGKDGNAGMGVMPADGGAEAVLGRGEQGVDLQSASRTLLELSPQATQELASQLRESGFSEQLIGKVMDGTITQTALLQEIAKEIAGHPELFTAHTLEGLFGGKEYTTLLKNEFARQWLLKPEEVAGERQIEELYRRLDTQTARLTDALSQTVRGDSPLAQTVNQLSGNVNFMNQLNQMFTYIQLPLKMNGENTHGELYVYTNKKNLAKKDGNVSALLHLDMEHLGPLDIYVAMQNQKVSTKFYLQDDSTIDLVARHIHMLDERLSRRGYSMSCEFIDKGMEKTAVEEVLEANRNAPVIASHSFDARA